MFKITFLGDTSFTGNFAQALFSSSEYIAEPLKGRLKESNFVVCNLEGPSVDDLPNYCRPDIRVVSPEKAVSSLTNLNVNVFNLANNHLFDCGVEGYKRTVELIESEEGLYFGAGHNINEAASSITLSNQAINVALIGMSHDEGMLADHSAPGVFCLKNVDLDFLSVRIQEARKKHDWVIINYHGGEEFSGYPIPHRRRLIKKIAKLGPDLIICHHPHVVQGFEIVNGVNVYYSLGNFLFDLDCHNGIDFVDEGILLEVSFTKNDFKVEVIPTRILRKQAMVELGDVQTVERYVALSEFGEYYKKWIKDSYRVVFRAKKMAKVPTANLSNNKSGRIKRLINLLFNKPNRRSIVFAAWFYKALMKLKVVSNVK